MTWWRIVKQGKILTLPKTSMRIKQPKKEIEEKDCNRKLKAYADKLKSRQHDSFTPWMQNHEYMDLDGHSSDHYKISGQGIDKKYTGKDWHQFVTIEQTDFHYDEIPELIACKLLDMINQHSNEDMWANAESENGYVYGIYNWTGQEEIDRWVKEKSAFAYPDSDMRPFKIDMLPLLVESLNDNKGGYDSTALGFGDYPFVKGAVYLRHKVEVDPHYLGKGFSAVDIEWK